MAPRVRKTKIVIKSAEEKAARASIIKGTQLSLAQNSARIGTQSRGAYGTRQLRQSGTNLAGYDMGRYTDTTKTVTVPVGSPGGGGRTVTGGTRKRTTTKPKGKGRHQSVDEKTGKRTPQSRLSDDRGDYLANSAAKAAAKRAADKKKREATARAKAAAAKQAAGTKGGGSKAV